MLVDCFNGRRIFWDAFIASSNSMMKFTYEGSHLTWAPRLIIGSQISDFQLSIRMRNHGKNKTTERTPDAILWWACSFLIYRDETIIHLTFKCSAGKIKVRIPKSSSSFPFPRHIKNVSDYNNMKAENLSLDATVVKNGRKQRDQSGVNLTDLQVLNLFDLGNVRFCI